MSKRVLIIEDEPAIADSIIYPLKTEGMSAHWVTTCGAAQEALNNDSYDLLILDVGLPDGNGFDFCRSLRKKSNVPVIFLTARADEIDRIVGLEIGADDYVVKPFSPRELSARAKAILRRVEIQEVGTETVAHSEFDVDTARCRISYHGTSLDLSRYEYLILGVLVGRPGWVFSREKIMEMVWDEPEFSMERTVDTHIKTIRAKLRAISPPYDPIQTHRGIGYSLKER